MMGRGKILSGLLYLAIRVIKHPCELWRVTTMELNIWTYIILHNMIIEDMLYGNDHEYKPVYDQADGTLLVITKFHMLQCSKRENRSNETQARCKRDLLDELWDKYGRCNRQN